MLKLRTALVVILSLPLNAALGQGTSPFFAKSYALVVGIDNYTDPGIEKLEYAVKDAQGFASFLLSQGFEVIDLYEHEATKDAIIAAFEDELIPKLSEDDRVAIFFAGHGMTRVLGADERGYLVPVDAKGSSYGSMIPLTQLRDMSGAMGAARHQLFILDSCFGGLAALRGVTAIQTIDPRMPNYLKAVTDRKARQLLTAGGPDQRVSDGGPDGHSLFTGQLLRALDEGAGDSNADGFITFSELFSYIQPAASSFDQTPGQAIFDGHEQGDFVFRRPGFRFDAATGEAVPERSSPSTPAIDVDAMVRAGKLAMQQMNYVEAWRQFEPPAELNNAEAMEYLGKLAYQGWGRPIDQALGIDWLVKAADRGRLAAMRNLVKIYSFDPAWRNPEQAARWQKALDEAEALQADIEIIDPSGQAGVGEPVVDADATAVTVPNAPSGLTVQ